MPENRIPQRIVSLQPSVTVTLRDLGLLHRLVACTKYCVEVCPEVRATGCVIVEDSWSAKAEQILAARPDLVIASVPYRMESVAEIIKSGIAFLGLAPRSLDDVYKDILMIARVAGSEEPGETEQCGLGVVQHMQQEIAEVQKENFQRGQASGLLRRVGQTADPVAALGSGAGGSSRRTVFRRARQTDHRGSGNRGQP